MRGKPSIIKDSDKIKQYLKQRFEELNLTGLAIVKDAQERGLKLTNGSLSKYLNHGNIDGGLSEENIIWLCTRYGIPLQLYIGKAVLQNKKIQFVLPSYNEEECLKQLEKLYSMPNGNKKTKRT